MTTPYLLHPAKSKFLAINMRTISINNPLSPPRMMLSTTSPKKQIPSSIASGVLFMRRNRLGHIATHE